MLVEACGFRAFSFIIRVSYGYSTSWLITAFNIKIKIPQPSYTNTWQTASRVSLKKTLCKIPGSSLLWHYLQSALWFWIWIWPQESKCTHAERCVCHLHISESVTYRWSWYARAKENKGTITTTISIHISIPFSCLHLFRLTYCYRSYTSQTPITFWSFPDM